jgi:hypothetical protein
MTEQKTLKELREEAGLGLGELDEAMDVPLGTTHHLEALGVTYPGLLVIEENAWVVPYSERFGEYKRFWFTPEEAVDKWREAVRVLEGMDGVAEALDNLALDAALTMALANSREELAGSIELLSSSRRREESFWLRW